ncbi:MAG: LamG domain-containing protein [Candidatus Micrarchaeota archaeon]
MKSLHLRNTGNSHGRHSTRGVIKSTLVAAGGSLIGLSAVSVLSGCLDTLKPSGTFIENQILCGVTPDGKSAYLMDGGKIIEETRKDKECKGIEAVSIPYCEDGEVKTREESCKDQGKRCNNTTKECGDAEVVCTDSNGSVLRTLGDEVLESKPKKECAPDGSAVIDRRCGDDKQIAETQTSCVEGELCDPGPFACKEIQLCEVSPDGSISVTKGINVTTVVPECDLNGTSYSRPRCDGDRLVPENINCPETHACTPGPLDSLNPRCDIPVDKCNTRPDGSVVQISGGQVVATEIKRCVDDSVVTPRCDGNQIARDTEVCDEGNHCEEVSVTCQVNLNCESLGGGRIRVTNGTNVREDSPVCREGRRSRTVPACNGQVPQDPVPVENCPVTHDCDELEGTCSVPVVLCSVRGNVGTVTVAGEVQEDKTRQKRCSDDGNSVLIPYCSSSNSLDVEERETQCSAGTQCDAGTLACETIRACQPLPNGVGIRVTEGTNISDIGPDCSDDLKSRTAPVCDGDVAQVPVPTVDCPVTHDCDELEGTCSVPVVLCTERPDGSVVQTEAGNPIKTESKKCDHNSVVTPRCDGNQIMLDTQPCLDHFACDAGTVSCKPLTECVVDGGTVRLLEGGQEIRSETSGCDGNTVVTASCAGNQINLARQDCVAPNFECNAIALGCDPVTRCTASNGSARVTRGVETIEEQQRRCSENQRSVLNFTCDGNQIVSDQQNCDPGFACGLQGGTVACYPTSARCFEDNGSAVLLDDEGQPVEASRRTPECDIGTNVLTTFRCNAEGQIISSPQACGNALDFACNSINRSCDPLSRCILDRGVGKFLVGGVEQPEHTLITNCDGNVLQVPLCQVQDQPPVLDDTDCRETGICNDLAAVCDPKNDCRINADGSAQLFVGGEPNGQPVSVQCEDNIIRIPMCVVDDAQNSASVTVIDRACGVNHECSVEERTCLPKPGCTPAGNGTVVLTLGGQFIGIESPACEGNDVRSFSCNIDGSYESYLESCGDPLDFRCSNARCEPLTRCIESKDGDEVVQSAVQMVGGVAQDATRKERQCANATSISVPQCEGTTPVHARVDCAQHNECDDVSKQCIPLTECRVNYSGGVPVMAEQTLGGQPNGVYEERRCSNGAVLLVPKCTNEAPDTDAVQCGAEQQCSVRNEIANCFSADAICVQDGDQTYFAVNEVEVAGTRRKPSCMDGIDAYGNKYRVLKPRCDGDVEANCAETENCLTQDGIGSCQEASVVCEQLQDGTGVIRRQARTLFEPVKHFCQDAWSWVRRICNVDQSYGQSQVIPCPNETDVCVEPGDVASCIEDTPVCTVDGVNHTATEAQGRKITVVTSECSIDRRALENAECDLQEQHAISNSVSCDAGAACNPQSLSCEAVSDILSGLVLRLPFDSVDAGMTAAVVYDGNGNPIQTLQATVSGPVLAEGIVGSGALSFNGINDRVSVPPIISNIGKDSFTALWWVKMPAGDVGTRRIFMSNIGVPGISGQFSFEAYNPDKSYVWWTSSPREFMSSGNLGIKDGNVHLIAYIRDKQNNKWQIFKDGEIFYEYLATAGSDIPMTDPGFAIGWFSHAGADQGISFFGVMDDVRLYGRVLTPQELQTVLSLGTF